MRYKELIKLRIQESELLSPEYDYLKINKRGLLKKKYPIPNSMSYTRDKVAAASFNNMRIYIEEHPGSDGEGWKNARDDVYIRAGREPVYGRNS